MHARKPEQIETEIEAERRKLRALDHAELVRLRAENDALRARLASVVCSSCDDGAITTGRGRIDPDGSQMVDEEPCSDCGGTGKHPERTGLEWRESRGSLIADDSFGRRWRIHETRALVPPRMVAFLVKQIKSPKGHNTSSATRTERTLEAAQRLASELAAVPPRSRR